MAEKWKFYGGKVDKLPLPKIRGKIAPTTRGESNFFPIPAYWDAFQYVPIHAQPVEKVISFPLLPIRINIDLVAQNTPARKRMNKCMNKTG